MVDRFNLVVPEGRARGGIDAHLELDELDEPVQFELKSTSTKSVSTVRDFGPEHIVKWRKLHWLFAFYNKDGNKIQYCRYASPADMAPWITDKERYVRADLVLAERAPQLITDDVLTEVLGEGATFSTSDAKAVMKKQWKAKQYRDNADLPDGGYSRSRMVELLQERCAYVIRRGATLNNPHINAPDLARFTRIDKDHAATLRQLVRAYLADADKAEAEGHEIEPIVDPVVAGQAKAAATDDATA